MCDSEYRKTAKELAKKISEEREKWSEPSITFADTVRRPLLEPRQKGFLEAALPAKKSLTMIPGIRGKTIGALSVEITTFEIIRNLARTELKAAFLLRSKLINKHRSDIVLPVVNHYLDRSLLFYDLSAKTKKTSQALKAYKRAKLVCTAIKYLTNNDRQNPQPSQRVISVMRGEIKL